MNRICTELRTVHASGASRVAVAFTRRSNLDKISFRFPTALVDKWSAKILENIQLSRRDESMKLINLSLAALAVVGLSACGDKRDGTAAAADFTFSGLASSLSPTLYSSLLNLHPFTAKTITHVMAINPSSQNPSRVLTTVAADGSFSLGVSSGKPWVIVFIDSAQVGKEMIVASYKSTAHDLDALATSAAGAADLGTIDFVGTLATGSTVDATLLASLGISSATADTLGVADDMCLRYINPDIDGDGTIDADQANANFGLDFHTRFDLKNNAGSGNAIMTDLENHFLDSTVAIHYGGVGAYLGWTNSYYGTANDPAISTIAFNGGTAVGLDGNSTTGWGDYHAAGKEFTAGTEMPQGTWVFNVNNAKTFTFTNIATKTDAELSAADNFIMPFIKFNTVGSATDAVVESIGYEWRIRRAGTWVASTLEELAAIVNSEGAYISFKPGYDSTDKNVGFKIPMTALSGTIPFTTSGAMGLEGGMTEAELVALTVKKVCHLGLSYDDKLGARYFAGVQNVTSGAGGCN